MCSGHITIMLPWSEKHRPTNLADVDGNEDVIRALRSFQTIDAVPHLILHGPPGCGKTSSVLALGKAFFGDTSTKVLELNAGDVRGVETMRTQIQFFTRCSSVTDTASNAMKLVVLDEADSLSHRAQCALCHLIETSSRCVRFCLCCNHVNKLSAGLRSRCTTFRFSALREEQLLRTMEAVAKKEGFDISKQGLAAVVRVSSGDARRAINLLQSLSLAQFDSCGYGVGDAERNHVERVYRYLGMATPTNVDAIFDSLLNHSFSVAYASLSCFVHDEQFSLAQIISPLVERVVSCGETVVRAEKVGPIMSMLARVERCLAQGGSEIIAIGATVAAFHSD